MKSVRLQFLESYRKPPPEHVTKANKTARSAGAVGAKAVTPQYVASTTQDGTILDFGSGPAAMHTQMLKGRGLDVTAHEFGGSVNPDIHDPDALSRQYDTVMASNVLNVQSTIEMLNYTLKQIAKCVKPGGRAVFNYPASPRHGNLAVAEVEKAIRKRFGSVERVGGTPSVPLYVAKEPK